MKIFYATIFILLSFQAAAIAPTTPASNFHFNAIDGGFFNIGWSSGNGARRVIIAPKPGIFEAIKLWLQPAPVFR
ncbi:MAG: hypothetical protein E6H09_01075 [Bacteroidetes bacterium]|nr:MAG: hypothetical protein E6H09_01075 [Bacteroidota bacterium]